MSKIRKRYRIRSYVLVNVSDPYKSEREAEEERMNLSYTGPENHYEVEAIIEPAEEKPSQQNVMSFDDAMFWRLRSDKRSKEIQEEQNEIIRQMCEFESFKEFIRDNYFIIHNLGTNKITVKERVFPKSMIDDSKPSIEKEVRKNRRECGICPVCGCPDYTIHHLKEMGLTSDLWKASMKCKNCGVVRIG